MGFEILAIPPKTLAALRAQEGAELLVDEEGGSPLRCCLGRAKAGEEIVLASYAPLREWVAETGADPGPYLESGPIFLHAEDCGGPVDQGFPEAHRGAPRVYRAYRRNGRILGGRLVQPGEVAECVLGEMFGDPEIAFIHVRAVEFGCFHFEIRRLPR
ncbi:MULTISPECIES: DUF1203 domain-containing protein [unclassified Crossiella]|uniref:DUF1203 domain-containing protein n=1 Tax=unclassified Crossiella TaxID=2620835 RepID=UPI001FFFC32E|nr:MULTISPECIES: DUF1203 domain-containing protein [unclassified Crossiella]MCK2236358.1 DUF1203 domain-containing protein [Crossiella sp. S99.2]MCK2250025.1 DUF1203 domain-containing protein [Crossiella sp. S99.1]